MRLSSRGALVLTLLAISTPSWAAPSFWSRVRTALCPAKRPASTTSWYRKEQQPAKLRCAPVKPAPATLPMAVLPNGRFVPPDSYRGGYHGNSEIPPEVALRDGLPAKGQDWRLREHSEQLSKSAFRGLTAVVSEPVSGNGAAYWAGAGGWVYDIRHVPGWDVNAQLFGRVQVGGYYRGNLMYGESEIAIPARVPPENIRAYGQVEEDSAGRLFVRRWILNPNYRE